MSVVSCLWSLAFDLVWFFGFRLSWTDLKHKEQRPKAKRLTTDH